MKNCDHYLDLAKIKRDLPSDYALAKLLCVGQSAITNYRKGRSHFDDAMAIKIASICELEPAEVLFAMQVERAKNDEARAVWSGLLEKFSKGFRWLALPADACGAWVPQV
ncbi:helix-turn-helix domain-containing protein [Paraburkholderia phenazinium]|uniref:helix-turn-helix domain-containing protein n=1 Tax=Paraburkholderia phenazinium TaxID=60549 RepID=UPI00158D460B|nr:helix-turn-helix domain-containing protein [Paraburkholderia phenazinium]